MSQEKLPREVRAYVEQEMMRYTANRKLLERIRDEVATRKPPRKLAKAHAGYTDETPGQAMVLMTSTAKLSMAQAVDAIEAAILEFTEEESQLFTLVFVRKLDMLAACRQASCSERTYYRIRARLVEAVAEHMGLAGRWQVQAGKG